MYTLTIKKYKHTNIYKLCSTFRHYDNQNVGTFIMYRNVDSNGNVMEVGCCILLNIPIEFCIDFRGLSQDLLNDLFVWFWC